MEIGFLVRKPGGTEQFIFVSFSTQMPKKIRFGFGHPVAKFRKAVKERLARFIQIVYVHLLFASTSESFGISSSRNTNFITSKAQRFRKLCHNGFSSCLDRVLVSYIQLSGLTVLASKNVLRSSLKTLGEAMLDSHFSSKNLTFSSEPIFTFVVIRCQGLGFEIDSCRLFVCETLHDSIFMLYR